MKKKFCILPRHWAFHFFWIKISFPQILSSRIYAFVENLSMGLSELHFSAFTVFLLGYLFCPNKVLSDEFQTFSRNFLVFCLGISSVVVETACYMSIRPFWRTKNFSENDIFKVFYRQHFDTRVEIGFYVYMGSFWGKILCIGIFLILLPLIQKSRNT